jgi:hypothetical protein
MHIDSMVLAVCVYLLFCVRRDDPLHNSLSQLTDVRLELCVNSILLSVIAKIELISELLWQLFVFSGDLFAKCNYLVT